VPQTTPDRRVRKTRQLLREALMELTLERGYDHVTVQDILEKADVGRSTFYAHYRDKDDLLVSEFEALHPDWTLPIGTGQAGGTADAGWLEPLRVAFRDAGNNRRQFKAMIGMQGSETVRRLLPEPLSRMVRELVLAQFPDRRSDDRQLDAVVQFIVSAFLGTLTWWLDTDALFEPDEIFEICRKLVVGGAAGFFGGAAGL